MKSGFESEQLNLEDSEDKDFEPDVREQLESVEEGENEDKIGVLVKKKSLKIVQRVAHFLVTRISS